MSEKVPVLFVVPSLRRAGAETQVVNLANGIEKSKFDKHLFTYIKHLDQFPRICHDQVSFYNHPRKGRFDPSVIMSLSKLIDRKSIAILYCALQHAVFYGWLGRLFSRKRPRLVAAIHTTLNPSLREECFDRFLYQWILRSCDRVLFVSTRQREHWVCKYPFLRNTSVVIHNGVNTSFFEPDRFLHEGLALRRSLGIPDKAPVVCCIANFRPEKAHDILINAFAKIDLNSFLLLAGDGATKPRIESLVRVAGLAGRVKFLGNVPDVRPVFAASNVSVLASTAVETFSMAMLESMSMRVPMVATDIGGASEAIIHGETGFLVPAGDAIALAIALREVLVDDRRLQFLGENCRKTVENHFSEERMIEKTESMLSLMK